MKSDFRRIFAGAVLTGALVLSGCGNSDDFVFTNTVNGGEANPETPTPPVAVSDQYQALGNAIMSQAAAGGVLTNDTTHGAAISAFDATGSDGGTLVLNADGSFTYTPVFGFVGAETFQYTLSNSDGDSSATINFTSTAQGFFVDNRAGATGNGSQAAPFDALLDALVVAQPGDTIVVSQGDGSSTGLAGAINLPQGVNLIGEGAGLVLAQTVLPPGNAPLLTGPIVLGGDNTVAGFRIASSADDGIQGVSVNNVTLRDNIFETPGVSHVDLDNVGGICNITDNVFNNVTSDQHYVDIDLNDTTATYSIERNRFLTDVNNDPDDACNVRTTGTSDLTLGFNDNEVTSVDSVNAFGDGLSVLNDGGQIALTITGNTYTRCGGDSISLSVDEPGSNVTIEANVTGNMVDSSGDNGIGASAGRGVATYTISGNVVTNSNNNGIETLTGGSGAFLNVLVQNNQVSNSGENGLIVGRNNGTTTIRYYDNNVTNSGIASIFGETNSSGVYCLDITGNTVDDDMIFNNLNVGTAVIQVEQLDVSHGGPLNSLNTFNGAAVQNMGATSVEDGFCSIP